MKDVLLDILAIPLVALALICLALSAGLEWLIIKLYDLQSVHRQIQQ